MGPDFTSVLGRLTGDGRAWSAEIPDNWRQGRTAFGGLIAALALEAAHRAFPGLAPLRSAQVSFIGPVPAGVEFDVSVLRKGRSATFIEVAAMAEGSCAAKAVFCFGAARDSVLTHVGPDAPPVNMPETVPSLFREDGPRPVFSTNFDMNLAAGYGLIAAAPEAKATLWVRHKDAAARDTETGFLALCDAPPPAAFTMLSEFTPISTMSWLLNVLTDDFKSRDGWWMIDNRSDHLAEGYASQAMAIFDRDGRPCALAHQTVAVFG